MNFKKILRQVSAAVASKDKFIEGVVGFNGYGFVFKDFKLITNIIYFQGTGGIYRLGSTKERMRHFNRDNDFSEDILSYEEYYDLRLIGSIKTLVPTLKFGGCYEHLFEVWVFVKTPNNRQFPITIYYGASGLSIGGWDPNFAYNFTQNEKFLYIIPKEIMSTINFSPHNLSEDEKEAPAEAIELALQKVPVADFYGIYKHDFSNTFMGIKDNKPFIIELGFSPKFSDIDLVLNLGMKFDISMKEFNKWDVN